MDEMLSIICHFYFWMFFLYHCLWLGYTYLFVWVFVVCAMILQRVFYGSKWQCRCFWHGV